MSATSLSGESSYPTEEVLNNFTILLAELDVTPALMLLGIGRFHFRAKQKALQELRAVAIALWRLALLRSFPEQGVSMFEAFLSRLQTQQKQQDAATFELHVRTYVNMLKEHGDKDFTGVSSDLLTRLASPPANNASIRLKLALYLRSLYTMIFNQLI